MLDEVRRRHGIAKLLVDRHAAPVQAQEVHNRLREIMPTYLRETDAMAVIVGSALVRMQAKRVLILPNSEMFLTEAEALDWLARF